MSHEPDFHFDQDPTARIRALEESLAFLSHEHDQLRAHFLALTKALETCERRVASLELSLREMHLEREGD